MFDTVKAFPGKVVVKVKTLYFTVFSKVGVLFVNVGTSLDEYGYMGLFKMDYEDDE